MPQSPPAIVMLNAFQHPLRGDARSTSGVYFLLFPAKAAVRPRPIKTKPLTHRSVLR